MRVGGSMPSELRKERRSCLWARMHAWLLARLERVNAEGSLRRDVGVM